MDDFITASVGLDVHVDSIAIGAAAAGREPPRFVGTVAPKLPALLKALGSVGPPQALRIVYEAGPCGYALVRELRSLRVSVRGGGRLEDPASARGEDQDGPARCAEAGESGASRGVGECDGTG